VKIEIDINPADIPVLIKSAERSIRQYKNIKLGFFPNAELIIRNCKVLIAAFKKAQKEMEECPK